MTTDKIAENGGGGNGGGGSGLGSATGHPAPNAGQVGSWLTLNLKDKKKGRAKRVEVSKNASFWIGAQDAMEKLALVVDRTGTTGKKKGAKQPPLHGEREAFKKRFGDKGVSLARDDKGIFCYTHRCRSPSYESVDKMSEKTVKFVDSTG